MIGALGIVSASTSRAIELVGSVLIEVLQLGFCVTLGKLAWREVSRCRNKLRFITTCSRRIKEILMVITTLVM